MTRWCVVGTCGRVVEPDITNGNRAGSGRYCDLHEGLSDVADSVIHRPHESMNQAGQGMFPLPEHTNDSSGIGKMASDLLDSRFPYGVNRRESRRRIPGSHPAGVLRRSDVDRLRASGIWTGHAWGVCSVCGEGAMVPRAGDRKTCFLTRGPDERGVTRDCPGKLIPEETPTPRQAAQRVVTGLFAAVRAVMGARRPLKVPYPKTPKEKSDEAPLL